MQKIVLSCNPILLDLPIFTVVANKIQQNTTKYNFFQKIPKKYTKKCKILLQVFPKNITRVVAIVTRVVAIVTRAVAILTHVVAVVTRVVAIVTRVVAIITRVVAIVTRVVPI